MFIRDGIKLLVICLSVLVTSAQDVDDVVETQTFTNQTDAKVHAKDDVGGTFVISEVAGSETVTDPSLPYLVLASQAGHNKSQPNSTVPNTVPQKRFSCQLNESSHLTSPTFQIVNGTVLQMLLKQDPNVTSRNQVAPCHIVLFYAPWCPFSIQAAPHLNSLPRGFPMLNFLAIDAHMHNSLSTSQGVMAIPSLFLFHNGKAAARYNDTEYQADLFSAFITRYTGIEPAGILNRTTEDFLGPLPTKVAQVADPWLILAWVVLFLSIIYWFSKSTFFWTLVENIRNTWREAEAQHEHAE